MLGIIADRLLGAVAAATALAEAGAAACITLDASPLAKFTVPVLLAGPAGIADAVARLAQAGCTQVLVTHDPGCAGPIGALADALVAALGTGFAVACPALPAAGFTLFQGYVFRRQMLLAGAAPGDQSSYVRLLSLQSDGTVGLVAHGVVQAGASAIRAALAGQREQGRRIAVIDALDEEDLRTLGSALAGQAAVLGSSALAPFLVAGVAAPAPLPAVPGPAAILAGATSRTAMFQAGSARDRLPHAALSAETLEWALSQLGDTPVLITPPPGPEPGAAFADLAVALVQHGVRRLLVTGTATVPAVVAALGVTRLTPGPAGLWLHAERAGAPLLLALTDGDVGGRDLFLQV